MLLQFLPIFILLLAAPAGLIYALWKQREETRLRWLIKVLYTGVFLLYALVVARWDWMSVYLRWVWTALFITAVVVSYRKVRSPAFFAPSGAVQSLKSASGNLLVLALFLAFLFLSVRGYIYSDEPVQLAFPLRDGRYIIGQGGNSTLINYHNSHPAQKYALDILALNTAGARAAGLYPADVERYVIFGHAVYAPCDGQVVEAVDGLADQAPPQTDTENPAGNHIIIACDGANVVLAHLKSGSVLVNSGAPVQTGDPIGRVGNTGNTSEPHLHIHATRPGSDGAVDGAGVPMLFDGRFLVRNSVISGSSR